MAAGVKAAAHQQAGEGSAVCQHRHGGYTSSRLAAAELHSARRRSALTLHKLTPETEEPSEYWRDESGAESQGKEKKKKGKRAVDCKPIISRCHLSLGLLFFFALPCLSGLRMSWKNEKLLPPLLQRERLFHHVHSSEFHPKSLSRCRPKKRKTFTRF